MGGGGGGVGEEFVRSVREQIVRTQFQAIYQHLWTCLCAIINKGERSGNAIQNVCADVMRITTRCVSRE